MADQLLRMAAARRNAKDQCKEIKDIAYSAGRDLMAQRGNINNSSRVMAKLDALEESIGRARRLVTDCGKNDGNIMEQVWRLFTAEDISKELQQVKEDMLLKWAKANSAFIKDHGMAPNANPAGHRPPQLQQERWTPEEHAPHQQGHHPILPQRQRLYQYAPPSPVANAHQTPHQQGHHPILPQRQRLYQYAPQRPVANAHQRPHQQGHHPILPQRQRLYQYAPQRPVANAHRRPVERAHGRPEVRAHPNRRWHAMPDN
ncbi:uncharacterized protein [Miscanthus floridulus]|uniref:uncharacterized protein isoform X2 n=1 Tax=Miscanthus floridulus TaxID=154761 RepID=UPI003459C610